MSRNHRTASRHRSKSPFGCHSTAACNSFHSISSRADGICRRSVMVGSIVVSCSKWSCSVCSPDNSCRARASRSCRSKIVCNASASDWMVRRNSGESVSAEYHESISAGMAFSIACVSTKAVLQRRPFRRELYTQECELLGRQYICRLHQQYFLCTKKDE